MSSFAVIHPTCPACGAAFEAGAADTLNVARMPWAREQILAGVFHRITCTHCNAEHQLERRFLYMNLPEGQVVVVETPLDEPEWPQREELALESLLSAAAEAPVSVDDVLAHAQVRAVFGLAALQDKLRVWEAGLDDAVLEVLKLELFTHLAREQGGRDAAGQPFDRLLHVVSVDRDHDVVLIEARPPPGAHPAPPTLHEAALYRYRELLAARATLAERFPGLFHRPYVSFRRLARERVLRRPDPGAPETNPAGGVS